MDRDTLRKQIYEEIHAQFESRLREAKRQKSELEEEMEVSSAKWRDERRRLNSEIDRLESKLGEARDARKKAPASKLTKSLDPAEVTRLQAAAEERLKKTTEEFEAERQKLQSEISRLQRGIADLIERSNNPLRSTQIEKEKLETRIEEALRARRQAEDNLLAARNEWDQEKLKLVSENVKARRAADQAKAARGERDEERLEQLEARLQEAIRTRDGLAGDLEKTRQELARFKQSYSAERDDLRIQLEKGKKEVAGLEKQLREVGSGREKAERELEKARQALAAQKAGQSEAGSRLKGELEDARAEAKLAERRVEEVKAAATKERAGLERQIRDLSSAREKLERDLDKAKRAPAVMKESQSAEIARLKAELESSRAEARASASGLSEFKAAAEKERASLEKRLRDASSAQEKLERDLDKARHASAAPQAPSGLKDSQSTEYARLRQELESARAEARLASAASREHTTTMARLKVELEAARETIRQLELRAGVATDSAESVDTEIVEQLRHQYEERMQEIIGQKTELSEQLRNATSLLEGERIKLAASENSSGKTTGNGLDGQIIDAEVARIQDLIAGIARIIDDPETELSTVIRKNVERAELDAYLKGILFSLGRGSGL